MPTKTTKNNTSAKNNESSKSKKTVKESTKSDKKDSQKKVIVKRRKFDLTPTRASAVAISSQANRAKKQALIERVGSGKSIPSSSSSKDNTKIPLWVWIFFGCSLLLFCISFYQAIFLPQLKNETAEISSDSESSWINLSNTEGNTDTLDYDSGNKEFDVNEPQNNEINELIITPTTVIETIQAYFSRLSNRQFDEAFALMIPALSNSNEIRQHFTSFRMDPFLDGIDGGKLEPTNFNYISTSTFGRDRYSFDISYVLSSNQERYDETWEMVVDTKGDTPKITSIICTTSKCSYHPIFWPENFGLMR